MDIIREDCIYARQSVDRKDSISIESQIDFCKYELKGGSCKVFKDKGYSGKNTDRPPMVISWSRQWLKVSAQKRWWQTPKLPNM